MPSKYSHALVLSHYNSHGLINVNDTPPPRPVSAKSTASSSTRSSRLPTRSSKVDQEASPRPSGRLRLTSSPPSAPHSGRLRLRSPSPPISSAPPLSPLPNSPTPPSHRRSPSVETQIYAPQFSPTPPPSQNHAESAYTKTHDFAYTPSRSSKVGAEHDVRSLPQKRLTSLHSPSLPFAWSDCYQGFDAEGWMPVAETSKPPRNIVVQKVQIPQEPQNQGLALVQLPHNRYNRIIVGAHGIAPQSPPSPPSTPSSDKSFSLEPAEERSQYTTSPPPVPERSSRRSPPRPLSPHQAGPTSTADLQPEPLKPKIPPAVRRPSVSTTTTQNSSVHASNSPGTRRRSLSITKRTSSLKAITSPPSLSMLTRQVPLDASTNPIPSSKSSIQPSKDDEQYERTPSIAAGSSLLNAATSPPPLSRTLTLTSKLFREDDEDLESLPSTLDFDALSSMDQEPDPAMFPHFSISSGPPSSRSSSFDSAAPPPIRIQGPMPSVLQDKTPVKTPKRSRRSSISSFFFARSSEPKAVFYSDTQPGEAPLPVSVSRPDVPMIPALSLSYKGQSPQPPKEERSGRKMSLKSRPVGRSRSAAPRGMTERRRSWFERG